MKHITKVTGIFLASVLAASTVMIPTFASTAQKSQENTPSAEPFKVEMIAKDNLDLSKYDDRLIDLTENSQKSSEVKPLYAEGEAVVVMKDNKRAVSLCSVCSVNKTYVFGGSKELNIAVVSSDKLTTKELIKQLNDDPNVKYAVPNSIKYVNRVAPLTNDRYSSEQWAIQNTGQNGGVSGLDTNPEKLWSAVNSNGAECVVAVMDTGIDAEHEDLKDILWKNTYTELPGYGGYGYDFTGSGFSGNMPVDDHGHGSHCAGIIAAAANNEKGITGINTSGVKVMSCKVGNYKGSIKLSDEIEAFKYVQKAMELGVNIKAINCSYGGFSSVSTKQTYDDIFDALGELGAVTCIAAGNESEDVDSTYYDEYGSEYLILPAASDSEYTITVAASDSSDIIADFSNYGEEKVDIAAPGVDILSSICDISYSQRLYTDEEWKNITAYSQDYENSPSEGDFGMLEYYRGSENDVGATSELVTPGSDGTGHALKLSAPEAGDYYYMFSTDFSTLNMDDNYFINMQVGNVEVGGKVYFINAPADYRDYSYGRLGNILDYFPWFGFNYNEFEGWRTVSDYFDWTYGGKSYYRDNLDRKLLIFIDANDGFEMQVDNINISKQGLSEDSLVKYDYWDGTSMATPYVTGAVALVANATKNNPMTPKEIISGIKTYSRDAESFDGLVETGKVLSLDKLADKIVGEPPVENTTAPQDEPTEPAVVPDEPTTPPTTPERPTPPAAEPTTPVNVETYLPGDMNFDGKVDSRDRIFLTRCLAKWAGYTLPDAVQIIR